MHSIWLKEPSMKSYEYFLKLQIYNVVIPLGRGATILPLGLHVLCLVLHVLWLVLHVLCPVLQVLWLVLHVLCLVLHVLCPSHLFSSNGVPGVRANLYLKS